MKTEDVLKEIVAVRQQREGAYGDHVWGHKCLGKAWAAILQAHLGITLPDIPPHIVAQMLSCTKSMRISLNGDGSSLRDSYVDQINYALLGMESDSRSTQNEN